MTSKRTHKFSPEVRARTVRLVLDHEGETQFALGCGHIDRAKIGCNGAGAA